MLGRSPDLHLPLHCLSKAGMIISIFQGRNLRFRSSLPQSATVSQIPRKMWGYTLPRMESNSSPGEVNIPQNQPWVVPSYPTLKTQVSKFCSEVTGDHACLLKPQNNQGNVHDPVFSPSLS